MIGKTLAHYKILSSLGAGGMGEVYRARDTKLDRDVALKVLPTDLAGDLERRARFIREAKALAGLKHPGIVTIYSVEEDNEVLFLTMELVDGRNLDNVIPEDGLSLPELLRIAIPLADAVSYAHKQRITHRDLKPTNIMLDEEGRTKVLDFGLAKLMAHSPTHDAATMMAEDSVTAEGKVLGTPAYMSPEQAEGKPIDARSDIFSLGIVLFEMSTGRRPFKGDTSISTITSILRDSPAQVHEINQRLPRHLGRIVARCLAKDPDRRYQSGLDVRNELEGLKEETTSATGMEIPATTAAAKPQPNRTPLFLGIGSVVVLAVILGIWQPWKGSEKDTAQVDPPSESSPAREAAEDGRTMIVILPFENLGPPEDAYFAAGISQEITSTLAGIDGLGLISRSSASRYAETDKTFHEIGNELGVSYIVEGTVRWQKQADGPDRVRIDPQLTRVADGTMVWTSQYDREMEDIFEIQTTIAREIAGQLGTALQIGGGKDGERLTENTEAYQLYLQAKSMVMKVNTDEDKYQVIATLERAVELDPTFVKAWSLLSTSHSGMYHEFIDRTEERLVMAREAADRVFEIAPDHPQGNVALGYYYYWGHKDYDNALAAFSKTGNLQENDSDVISAIAYIRRRQGRWEDALQLLLSAFRLSPKETNLASEVSETLTALRRHEEAQEWSDQAIALDPGVEWVYMTKAFNHLVYKGDAATAESIARQSPTFLDSDWPQIFSFFRVHAKEYQEAFSIVAADTAEVYQDQEIFYPRPLWMGIVAWCMDDSEMVNELATESLGYLQGIIKENSRDPRLRLALGLTYALLGRKTEALREGRLATDIYPMSRDAYLGSEYLVELTRIYAIIGEEDAALDLIEELLSIPCYLTPKVIQIAPWYRSLHGNPRYEAMVSGTS